MEVNLYPQQRYTSYYIPPVYSPQQQFPLYSLITPQAWSTTHSFIDPTLVRPQPSSLLGGRYVKGIKSVTVSEAVISVDPSPCFPF